MSAPFSWDTHTPATGFECRTGEQGYTSPGLESDQANLMALDLLRQFDGLPIVAVKQVLNRALFWLDAVSTLDCGEATEFARAVEGFRRAAGGSL